MKNLKTPGKSGELAGMLFFHVWSYLEGSSPLNFGLVKFSPIFRKLRNTCLSRDVSFRQDLNFVLYDSFIANEPAERRREAGEAAAL